jgi:hypothetical protein
MNPNQVTLRSLFLFAIAIAFGGCQLFGDSNANPDSVGAFFRGNLFMTSDKGSSWFEKSHHFSHMDGLVCFSDAKILALGNDDSDITTSLIRSEPSGTEFGIWQRESLPDIGLSRFTAIEIQNPDQCWLAGPSLYKLSGSSWVKQSGLSSVGLVKFLWSKSQFGLCTSTGSSGEVVLNLTTDGGQTWTEQEFQKGIKNFALINDSTYVVSLDDGGEFRGIFRTSDFGQTWEKTSYQLVKEIEFQPNSSVGFAMDNNTVYRSTDGGETWQDFELLPSNSMATGYSFEKIASAGEGVWFIGEVNTFYDEVSNKVFKYEYYVRRLKDNGASSGGALIASSSGESNKPSAFSLISVNKHNPIQAYVFLD